MLKKINRLICLAGLTAALPAQDIDTLSSNTQQLQVTLTMDQSTYFSGESAVITITIKNPTSGPLKVIAPFSTECFILYSQAVDGSVKRAEEDYCRFWDISSTTPTTIFAAGEQRQFVLNSYDSSFGAEISPMGCRPCRVEKAP